MGSQSSAELVRGIYRAFAALDFGWLTEVFADDVDMVQVGRNGLAGTFRGREALFGHFADIPKLTDGLTMAPYEVAAGGDYVAALNLMTVTRNGESRDFRVIHLFRIVGGKVVELRSIPEDPYGFDAFMA